ncbi:MAG: hypothetical protein Fur003_1810 [Candidatus Dojkabacteria bacterium]
MATKSTKSTAKPDTSAYKSRNAGESEVITIELQNLLTLASVLLSGIMISLSIFFSIKNYVGGNVLGATNTNTTTDTTTAAQPTQTASLDQIKDLFKKGNMYFGDADRDVLFAVFEDPSCPYCHIASGHNAELNKSAGGQFLLTADGGTYVAPVIEMKKLLDEKKASFVYVYSNGHGNGVLATQALYCAYDKDKFWQVHDKLMSAEGYDMINNTVKNDTAQSGTLANFLASAIDKNYMKSCLESGKYASKVAQDDQLAGTYGVSGTPAFFVNDKLYGGAYNWTDMKSVVDAALN